jgi:hypothetical protein
LTLSSSRLGFVQLITLMLYVVPFFHFMVGRLVDWNWPAVGNVPGGANATANVTASPSVRNLLVVTVSCTTAASGYICSKDVWTRNKLSFAPACGVSRIHHETLKKFLTQNWRPFAKVILMRKVPRKFSIFHFPGLQTQDRLFVFCSPRHTNFLAAKIVSVCHSHLFAFLATFGTAVH